LHLAINTTASDLAAQFVHWLTAVVHDSAQRHLDLFAHRLAWGGWARPADREHAGDGGVGRKIDVDRWKRQILRLPARGQLDSLGGRSDWGATFSVGCKLCALAAAIVLAACGVAQLASGITFQVAACASCIQLAFWLAACWLIGGPALEASVQAAAAACLASVGASRAAGRHLATVSGCFAASVSFAASVFHLAVSSGCVQWPAAAAFTVAAYAALLWCTSVGPWVWQIAALLLLPPDAAEVSRWSHPVFYGCFPVTEARGGTWLRAPRAQSQWCSLLVASLARLRLPHPHRLSCARSAPRPSN